MPVNANNPYRPDEPLYAVFENGSPELRAALLDDYQKTYSDGRVYDDLRTGLTEMHAVVQDVLSDPYAPKAWGAPAEEDFVCPSGQLCRIRRVDIMDLLGDGLLNSVDFLTDVVQKEAIPADKGKPSGAAGMVDTSLANLTSAPEKMDKFRKAVDGVILRVVVKPQIYPVPHEGFDRVDGHVYVDSIAFTDKIEIFNYAVTGKRSEEIRQFRQKSDESVGAVESGTDVRPETVNLPEDGNTP